MKGLSPFKRAHGLLGFNMVRVHIGKYRPQNAHYGFYRDDLPSGDVIIIRRKVGETTDYLHPNNRQVRLQRLNFGLASTHYSHLTPIQKGELKYVAEVVPYVRGHSKSGTKLLQGRPLFIAKDIHALNETQSQIPTPLQICIVLTDQDLNPIEGTIHLYYQHLGMWDETLGKQISPSYWLFPSVPKGAPVYHPIGQAIGYHDPQDPETTYLSQKELMRYHYHRLSVIIPSAILRPDGPGDETTIITQQPVTGEHWDKVDDVIPDGFDTFVREERYLIGDSHGRDLYHLSASPGYPKILSVTAYIYCCRTWVGEIIAEAATAIRTHGTTYQGASQTLTDDWKYYATTYITNPFTNLPWTAEEIDALQAGVYLRAYRYGFAPNWVESYCSQVYVEVEYSQQQ